jgi:hypothetical protein
MYFTSEKTRPRSGSTGEAMSSATCVSATFSMIVCLTVVVFFFYFLSYVGWAALEGMYLYTYKCVYVHVYVC